MLIDGLLDPFSKKHMGELTEELIKNNIISTVELNQIEKEIISKIENDWNKALNSEFPDKSNLNKFVYS